MLQCFTDTKGQFQNFSFTPSHTERGYESGAAFVFPDQKLVGAQPYQEIEIFLQRNHIQKLE